MFLSHFLQITKWSKMSIHPSFSKEKTFLLKKIITRHLRIGGYILRERSRHVERSVNLEGTRN